MINAGVRYLKKNDHVKVQPQSVTDWTVLALVAAGKKDKELFKDAAQYDPKITGADTDASEIARHIMVLKALGKHPRKYKGVNYVERLKKLNTPETQNQFGTDPAYCNDDISAALALIAAREAADSMYLHNAMKHALTCVNEDGGIGFSQSSGSSVDMTALFLEAAGYLEHKKKFTLDLTEARQNAIEYLESAQNFDGGFGYLPDDLYSNTSSTAWAARGLRGVDKKLKLTTANNRSVLNYFADVQLKSGAFLYQKSNVALSQNRDMNQLTTAQAVLALTGKPLPIFPNNK